MAVAEKKTSFRLRKAFFIFQRALVVALVAHAFYTKFRLIVHPYSGCVLVLKMPMISANLFMSSDYGNFIFAPYSTPYILILNYSQMDV